MTDPFGPQPMEQFHELAESLKSDDRNNLAYWLPKIEAGGLLVPRTIIVQTLDAQAVSERLWFCDTADLSMVLDGVTPKGWDGLIGLLKSAGDILDWPCFLRTGHTSGKHSWSQTCHVPSPDQMEGHVAALIEESAMCGIFGLPVSTWAVREMIPVESICRCEGYLGMPVVREFRLFVEDGAVTHVQPYWPSDAVETGRPDSEHWRTDLEIISELPESTRLRLEDYAKTAVAAIGEGDWSVDFLEGHDGRWWLTDMAVASESYRYDPPSKPLRSKDGEHCDDCGGRIEVTNEAAFCDTCTAANEL